MVCIRTKGWSVDWMVRNPMSRRAWNIHDEGVQRKILDMVRKSKPDYIEISTNGNDEKSKELNDFLSEICVTQNKNGRTFVIDQPVIVSMKSMGNLRKLRKLPQVDQAIIYNLGGTVRYVSNSGSVIGQLERLRSNLDPGAGVKVGLEIDRCSQNTKTLLSLGAHESLHSEEEVNGHFVDDTSGVTLCNKLVHAGRDEDFQGDGCL